MNAGNDIVKELQELNSPLADMPRTMPFAVPEGYFSGFSAESIMATHDPAIDLPKNMPFAVPEGYFADLSARILDRVGEPSFGPARQLPFAVPEGYFERMPANILAAVKAAAGEEDEQAAPQAPETRLIAFRPQWRSLRWAAAAVLVMGIGIGSFLRFGGTAVGTSAARQLAQLDKGVISSYVQQNIDDFDAELLTEHNAVLNNSAEKNIRKLDKQDIIRYLDDDAGWKENGDN